MGDLRTPEDVMNEYAFEVKVRAVVRVRASSQKQASEVVEAVLGAPSAEEIGLANNNNAGVGRTATVAGVVFQHTGAPRMLKEPETPSQAA
jgi:hypothetical protein